MKLKFRNPFYSPVPIEEIYRKAVLALMVSGAVVLSACGGENQAGSSSNADKEETVDMAQWSADELSDEQEDEFGDFMEADDPPLTDPLDKMVDAGTMSIGMVEKAGMTTTAAAKILSSTSSASSSATQKSTASTRTSVYNAPRGYGGRFYHQPTTQRDAIRLADQATFGPTYAMTQYVKKYGVERWVSAQMRTWRSYYSRGGSGRIHQVKSQTSFCDLPRYKSQYCWRHYYSHVPLVMDFYRNATYRSDQLRQRVAFAYQQIFVVSTHEISAVYGMRFYNNMFLKAAFYNFRDIIRGVILQPVMGDYLDHVNNDKEEPNENFARELLQLFSIGTCELNSDGTLRGGTCVPTYDNEMVRNYAFALTGLTYPKGGANYWGCWPRGANCRYYHGYMKPVEAMHDSSARDLLAGVSLPEGHKTLEAVEMVVDSIMAHPNTGPFIGKQLIQKLVTSNPSPAYVARVAAAFETGTFRGFGRGNKGDMRAVIAAILLDEEARNPNPDSSFGRLREPVHFQAAVLRSMGGYTDGVPFVYEWADPQPVFQSPSVFNFYPPDYPLSGEPGMVGPEFAIFNSNAAMTRMNYLNRMLWWGAYDRDRSFSRTFGTNFRYHYFYKLAKDPEALVDHISNLALGEPLPEAARADVIAAVTAVRQPAQGTWNDYYEFLRNRIRQAAYLVFASPQYQMIR
ncbi:DUF1800 family protein [Hydrogenophaga sp. 5NK40-0174]|uniref:DUF1800 domain-containing protein n=1 Tax=Hydrogenophaga sp. 5NK40-0174 TaxID=3127649 RepID=UPI003108FDE0